MPPRDLDPLIHQPVRLRIMTVLFRNRHETAAELRRMLDLTPGNLGSHVARLEAEGYLSSRRVLAGLGFELQYAVTEKGAAAFRAYLLALKQMLRELEGGASTDASGATAREPTAHASPF